MGDRDAEASTTPQRPRSDYMSPPCQTWLAPRQGQDPRDPHRGSRLLWGLVTRSSANYCAELARIVALDVCVRIAAPRSRCIVPECAMRITRVETANIAGLVDGATNLPDSQVAALAGPNGTGKSKLLACMLIPWTHSMPEPRNDQVEAVVHVTVKFSNAEREILEQYRIASGWTHESSVPTETVFTARATPLAGVRVTTDVSPITLTNMAGNSDLLKRQPSLDLVFLPAERRLTAPISAGVDLTQLSEEVAIAKLAEARNTVHTNSGRLDDSEFESYATALCFQGALASTGPGVTAATQPRWVAFKAAVDELLHPKQLLPLTVEHSSGLRIGLADGSAHPVAALSSGERQALIIISRVFRAGEGHSFVVIDEPDAYLHPTLSTRLLKALRPGLGDQGRMLVATHSPAILDAIPPSAIVRLSHLEPPQLVETESERLELYREAGFRASTLTQSEVLVLTEGTFDASVIPLLVPSVSSSAIKDAGGRQQVLSQVQSLSVYDLPIVGVVDADVRAPAPPAAVAQHVHVWPAADIEGVLLQDDSFITKAIEGKLLKPSTCSTLPNARQVLLDLLLAQRDNAIAEYAQRLLREQVSIKWPSPKGEDALQRLRDLAAQPQTRPDTTTIESAIGQAEEAWAEALPAPWTMVRGKYIIGEFVSKHAVVSNAGEFVAAVLAHSPKVAAMDELGELVAKAVSN